MSVTTVKSGKAVQHVKTRTKVVPRIDPDEDFSDVDGSGTMMFGLDNKDPGKRYVFAENTREDISRYQSGQADGLRWQVEHYEGDDVEGALCPSGYKGLLKKGETIAVGTHVLMSVDRALKEKRERMEASKTRQANQLFARNRQRDVVAGDHQGEWNGLESYR